MYKDVRSSTICNRIKENYQIFVNWRMSILLCISTTESLTVVSMNEVKQNLMNHKTIHRVKKEKQVVEKWSVQSDF